MNFLKVVFHTFWRRAILIVFFALCWCAVEKRLNNFLLSEVLMGQRRRNLLQSIETLKR
jgi:hypothetical protein